MKAFNFILLFFAFTNCKGNSQDSSESIQDAKKNNDFLPVTFRIKDTSIFKKGFFVNVFTYSDSLFTTTNVLNLKKDIETQIHINRPVLLIHADKEHTPFWVRPGKVINIRKGKDGKIIFDANNSEILTNELHLFKELCSKYGELSPMVSFSPTLSMTKVTSIESLKIVENKIAQLGKKRMGFIDSFIAIKPLGKDLLNIAHLLVQYAVINDKLMLYYSNKEFLIKQQIFDKSIDNCITEINSMEFVPYSTCISALNNIVSIANTKFLGNIIFSKEDFEKKFNYTSKKFTSIQKDFLLSQLIFGSFAKGLDIPNAYIEKYEMECTNSSMKAQILEKLRPKDSLVLNNGKNNLLLPNGKENVFLEDILIKQKGRLIFLDFWASWCVPCLDEMPFSHALSEKYNNKDVVFIYISVEENKDNWLKSIQTQKLVNENSFLFLNPDNAPFIKQYKINTFPRYMLISKEGKVLNADAPRPSDPQLVQLINRHFTQ